MPQIPTFIAPGATMPNAPPFANPDEASAGAAASVRSGQQSMSVMDQWLEKYADAKRGAMEDAGVASGTKLLGDLEFAQSKIPDRDQAYQGFLQGAGIAQDAQGNLQVQPGGIIQKTLDGIGDPIVKQNVQGQLLKQASMRLLTTQNAAFTLESGARRGALDTQLFQYANDASAASSPQLRGVLTDNANTAIDNAVKGGWLHPEEGATRKIQFNSQLAGADADSYIRVAAQAAGAGRLSPLDISNTISNPKNFPGMTVQQREQKADEALRLGRTIVSMTTAAQTHDDAMADKALKKDQASNAAGIIAKVVTAPPGQAAALDPGDLAKLVKNQSLSEAGFSAIMAAQTRAVAGKDDPATVQDLYRRFGNGEDVSHDALAAYGNKKLSDGTVKQLAEAQSNRDKGGDSAVDKQNFATLKGALNGYAIEQSGFAFEKEPAKQAAAQLWTNAQSEWTQRVTINHEDSNAVRADMLNRYVKAPGSAEGLPTPRLGAVSSTADVAGVAAKTEQAYQAKQISPSVYEAEKGLLVQYNRLFQQQEAAAAAKKAAGVPRPGGSASSPSIDVNP